MRKISATFLFPVNRPPLKNGIIICDDDGTVVDLIDTGGKLKEMAGLEYYSGILAPGFVNAHCHLELSHLHGKIPEKTGIGGFLGDISQLRNKQPENTETTIRKADRMMWAAGIAAVGDISNSTASLATKLKSKIFYHTFVETFGFHPSRAERAFEMACNVRDEFRKNHLPAFIVPHSPYSVSKPLFKKIEEMARDEKGILSIHNQESKSEARFFYNGTGPIAHHLQNNLGIDISHWEPTGKSSLFSALPFLPEENPLLLVHNTFTEKQDLDELKKIRPVNNTFWVLCPNSNLFIENQLPPVALFRDEQLNICLGTDSLASNHQLSILSEMVTLQQNFPEISFGEILGWGTLNGARALKIDHHFGSFGKGKKPGVNLITGFDFKTMKLSGNSSVKRLL